MLFSRTKHGKHDGDFFLGGALCCAAPPLLNIAAAPALVFVVVATPAATPASASSCEQTSPPISFSLRVADEVLGIAGQVRRQLFLRVERLVAGLANKAAVRVPGDEVPWHASQMSGQSLLGFEGLVTGHANELPAGRPAAARPAVSGAVPPPVAEHGPEDPPVVFILMASRVVVITGIATITICCIRPPFAWRRFFHPRRQRVLHSTPLERRFFARRPLAAVHTRRRGGRGCVIIARRIALRCCFSPTIGAVDGPFLQVKRHSQETD